MKISIEAKDKTISTIVLYLLLGAIVVIALITYQHVHIKQSSGIEVRTDAP